MFEKDLSDKLKRIFDVSKVSYDHTSASQEQECLFINIQTAKNNIKDGRFVGKVQGKLNMFASLVKLPYGYFSKCINATNREDLKDLFFFDFEENAGTIENITERTLSFIYLFDMQYNPNFGEITSLVDTITME